MKFTQRLALILALSAVVSSAHAVSPRDQYAMDTRDAASRYEQDRQVCEDERNQGQRKKCLRAAKQENNNALAAAKRNMQGTSGNRGKMACLECGKVTSIDVNRKKGDSNALGVVAGGAAGALLGNQVGGGSGKTLATIAGAVGGAYAGKKIQEKSNESTVWTVNVQYDNGARGQFNFERDPGLQNGDRVRRAGESLSRM